MLYNVICYCLEHDNYLGYFARRSVLPNAKEAHAPQKPAVAREEGYVAMCRFKCHVFPNAVVAKHKKRQEKPGDKARSTCALCVLSVPFLYHIFDIFVFHDGKKNINKKHQDEIKQFCQRCSHVVFIHG